MQKILVLVIFVIATVRVSAEPATKAPPPTTAIKGEKKELYIPKDLEDSFQELDKLFRPEDQEKIRKGDLTVIGMHMGLGRGLRNEWGLWGGSRLAKFFNQMGVFHPDDMSSIILESYVRRLKNVPIRLEEQVAYYKEYWDKAKKAEAAAKRKKS